MSTEAKIIAEIEALKAHDLDTQDLYREVCTILFFRYGITPTANKLYQYVRKGSMSAPAEALAKFWSDLREKSRVRIEHPDLPEGLKTAAGELVASLWSLAQAGAQDGLVVFRQEAQGKVTESLQAVAAADQARVAAEAESNQTRKALRAANERVLDLERDLAGERARTESLEQQIGSARHQQTALEIALGDARKDYTAELEKARQEIRRTEERLEASEKRALLEIDHERQMTAKSQRELLQLRNSTLENDAQLRTELATSKSELANVRQMLGVAEGRLEELRGGNEKQLKELAALRLTIGNQETQLALLQREVELAQSVSKQLQESRTSKSETLKAPRRNRKTLVI